MGPPKGNKRQRAARKKFFEENPDKRPVPPPQPVSGEKKKSRKRDGHGRVQKKGPTKHPLRIPGHRPGEMCFICKGSDHIARDCPTKASADRKKMCLQCRQWGHTMKACPQTASAGTAGAEGAKGPRICYNCNSTEHRLADCPEPKQEGGTAYAVCFVCGEKGHLSRSCPSNPHGLYPKGGCCKTCGEVSHLAKDCPKKSEAKKSASLTRGAVRPNNPRLGTISTDVAAGANGRRIVFPSGDDLEDDFEDVGAGPMHSSDGAAVLGEEDDDEAGEGGDGEEAEEGDEAREQSRSLTDGQGQPRKRKPGVDSLKPGFSKAKKAKKSVKVVQF